MQRLLLILIMIVSCICGLFADGGQLGSAGASSPRFEKRGEFTVMGIQAKDALDETTMDKIRKEFAENKQAIPQTIDDSEYGITFFGKEFDPAKKTGYYYLVGKQVSQVAEVPAGMTLHKVPGALYAVFEHRGPATSIDKTFAYIFGEWIPKSGYSPAMQDIIERYDSRYKIESPDSIMEIWVPLINKNAN